MRRPATTKEAQYSTPFPVAAALVRGEVGPDEVLEAALGDPEILRVADMVMIGEEARFNAAFPARRIARVTIELEDGLRLVSDPTEAPGDPEAPVGRSERIAKFHGYCDPALGPTRARALQEAVGRLGEGGGLADLLALAGDPVG